MFGCKQKATLQEQHNAIAQLQLEHATMLEAVTDMIKVKRAQLNRITTLERVSQECMKAIDNTRQHVFRNTRQIAEDAKVWINNTELLYKAIVASESVIEDIHKMIYKIQTEMDKDSKAATGSAEVLRARAGCHNQQMLNQQKRIVSLEREMSTRKQVNTIQSDRINGIAAQVAALSEKV